MLDKKTEPPVTAPVSFLKLVPPPVAQLADYNNDSRSASVEATLEKVLAMVREGAVKGSKAVVILLNDDGAGTYSPAWWQVGMWNSEVITLLAVIQAQLTHRLAGLED